jgi:hypothetical protein
MSRWLAVMVLGAALGMVFAALPTISLAQEPGAHTALIQIDELISRLAQLKDSLHFQDEARIFVTEKEAREVKTALLTKGPFHAQTRH